MSEANVSTERQPDVWQARGDPKLINLPVLHQSHALCISNDLSKLSPKLVQIRQGEIALVSIKFHLMYYCLINSMHLPNKCSLNVVFLSFYRRKVCCPLDVVFKKAVKSAQ